MGDIEIREIMANSRIEFLELGEERTERVRGAVLQRLRRLCDEPEVLEAEILDLDLFMEELQFYISDLPVWNRRQIRRRVEILSVKPRIESETIEMSAQYRKAAAQSFK